MVAPEDLILSKLHWSKNTPSEMHTRDVRTIIETLPDLDWPYLAKWPELVGFIGSVGGSEAGMKDTPRHIENRFREMMLARSPGGRLAMACGMFATARSLVLAGIRNTHGELNSVETRGQLFLRFYGMDFEPEKRERILEHLCKAEEALP